VVEVISPSTAARDIAEKYANYFRHPSVQHYLILFIDKRIAILHSRSEGETLKSRIAREGDRLSLDSPGIEVAVSDFFAGLDSAFADE
jgi:Uma2 family endonuclease